MYVDRVILKQFGNRQDGKERALLELDRRMAEFLAAKQGKSSTETMNHVRRQRKSIREELTSV